MQDTCTGPLMVMVIMPIIGAATDGFVGAGMSADMMMPMMVIVVIVGGSPREVPPS